MTLMTDMYSFHTFFTLFRVLGYPVLLACLSCPIVSVNYAWTLTPLV